MNNKEFNGLLDLWKKKKLREAEGIKPPGSKDCLYFTEIEECVKDGSDKLTAAQKQHIQSCAHCQKMIAYYEEALAEEKHPIPIYERTSQALNAFTRFAPALAPVLAIVIFFFIFSNKPLELKNYSIEFARPTIETRGLHLPSERLFKIKLAANYDCYAYLFEAQGSNATLLLQEKLKKRVENTLPSEKDTWIKKEGKLILLLSKNPVKNIPSAEETINRNYNKSEKEILELIKGELKRNDILIKFL